MYQGDKLGEAFTKALNLVAVPIALPDVLSSLSTGMINTAYAPTLGIVGLQWHTKVSYLMEPPFAFHFQGFVLSGKSWRKIRIDDQKLISKVAAKYAKKISDSNYADGTVSLEAIKKQGVKIVRWPESDVTGLTKVRSEVMDTLVKESVECGYRKKVQGKALSYDSCNDRIKHN